MIFFRVQNILPKIQCCSYRNLYYIFQTKYTWIKWKLQHYINNFYWLNFLHLSNMNHSVQNACKPQDLGHQWIQSNVPIHIMFFMFMYNNERAFFTLFHSSTTAEQFHFKSTPLEGRCRKTMKNHQIFRKKMMGFEVVPSFYLVLTVWRWTIVKITLTKLKQTKFSMSFGKKYTTYTT